MLLFHRVRQQFQFFDAIRIDSVRWPGNQESAWADERFSLTLIYGKVLSIFARVRLVFDSRDGHLRDPTSTGEAESSARSNHANTI